MPDGFHNLQLMLQKVIHHRGEVGICGSCMDARGMQTSELAEGVHRGTLEELADWSEWADKVFVF